VALRIAQGLKHAVEEQGYWRELWRGDRPAAELSCQAAFKLVAQSWCEPHDIDLSPETNIGRGPVDFKLSNGWSSRALIEVKLASNSRFWRGLRKQLPQYMKSEGIETGVFVAFVFTEAEARMASELRKVAKAVEEETGYRISTVVIDARRDNKASASKL
jgi:hypothetical protein